MLAIGDIGALRRSHVAFATRLAMFVDALLVGCVLPAGRGGSNDVAAGQCRCSRPRRPSVLLLVKTDRRR